MDAMADDALQPAARSTVGLAAVPLTEFSETNALLADAPTQVFAYTHFGGSGANDTLTITVTTGDAVWRVEGAWALW
jgi:hypothetical protein